MKRKEDDKHRARGQVSYTLRHEVIRAAKLRAKKENRSVSRMVDVLLSTALFKELEEIGARERKSSEREDGYSDCS